MLYSGSESWTYYRICYSSFSLQHSVVFTAFVLLSLASRITALGKRQPTLPKAQVFRLGEINDGPFCIQEGKGARPSEIS